MRPRTILVAGTIAIAVLVAAALIALSFWGRGVVVAEHAPPAPEPARDERPVPVLPTALAAPGAGTAVPPAGGPPTIPWRDVPVSARIHQLGPEVAGPVMQGLDAARERMDPCFEAEAQRLRTRPPPAQQTYGPAILTLSLENGAGTVVVVDSELESLGRSTPELVECCRDFLRGYSIRAPAAPPGERNRLRYVLQ